MYALPIIATALLLVALYYHFTDTPSPVNRLWYERLPKAHRYLYFDLCTLHGDSMIHNAIGYSIDKSEASGNDLGFYEAVEFIYSQGLDNPAIMIEAVGFDIWESVVRIKEGEVAAMKMHLQLN